MKITIYTINDCKFSQAEKEYLKNNNIPFEEKNLETNRNNLTEMLKVSDNFAGTPVTKVEKDGGEIMILKGFTQDEFAKALNLSPSSVVIPSSETAPANAESTEPTATPTPPVSQEPPAAPMSASTPEVKSEDAPMTQTTEPKPTNIPDMSIESLSEPAVSTQSSESSSTPEPVIPPSPAVATPEPPVNPLENQEVGPISLDPQTTTPASPAAPSTPMSTSMPQAPAAAAPTEEKPKNSEGLDSVLQNLQSQVQAGVPPTDTTPKS